MAGSQRLCSLTRQSVGDVSELYNTSSIWMSGVYNDKVLIDDKHFMIINYEGQNSHRDDKYIMVGSYFFIKERGNYKFVGNVSSWKQISVSNTQGVPHKYQLVIMKKEPQYFRRKSDALISFGLLGGSISSGIIPHKQSKTI
jgi:hypothetical protein